VDFNLSEEQIAIQKAAKEFAQGEFDPEYATDLDRNRQFPLKIWKRASELGFTGIHFPEKYGGQDLGVLENALVVLSPTFRGRYGPWLFRFRFRDDSPIRQ
jgi:alkylation response protein AidB-like acyl-CoA dehydrogenase